MAPCRIERVASLEQRPESSLWTEQAHNGPIMSDLPIPASRRAARAGFANSSRGLASRSRGMAQKPAGAVFCRNAREESEIISLARPQWRGYGETRAKGPAFRIPGFHSGRDTIGH